MKEWMSLFLLIVAVSLFGSFGFLFFRPSAAFIGFAHAVGEILWFFIVLVSILYLKAKVVELEEEMNYERRRTEVEIEHLRMLIQHPVTQHQSGVKNHEQTPTKNTRRRWRRLPTACFWYLRKPLH